MSNTFHYTVKAKDESKPATKSAEKNMDDMSKAAEKAGDTIKKALTATAVLAGLQMIASAIQDSIRAFSAYESQVVRLDAVMQATGHAAGFTTRQLEEMATSLSRETNKSAQDIMSMQSVLGTFMSISGDVFDRTMSIAVDLSEVFGQDLKASATQLGKALEDPITGMTALREVGVSFTQEQKDLVREMQAVGDISGAQGVILGVLESQVGGVGRAMRDTTEGSMAAFSEAWSVLRGNMGEAAAEKMRPIRDFFTGLMEDMNDAATAARTLKQSMEQFTGVMEAGGDISAAGQIEGYIESLQVILEEDRRHIERIEAQIAALDPRAMQMREGLQAQLEIRENRIAQVMEQIHAAEQAQEEQRQDRAISAASEERAQAAQALRDQFAEVRDGLIAQLSLNDRMKNIWQDQFNKEQANHSAVVGALNMLAQMGFDIDGANIQHILGEFGHMIIDPMEDIGKGITESLTKNSKLIEKGFDKLDLYARNTHEIVAGAVSAFDEGDTTVTRTGRLMPGMEPHALQGFTDAVAPFAGAMFNAITSISSLVAALDPLGTIIGMMAEMLTPVVDAVLRPVFDTFADIARFLASALLPVFQALAPVIEVARILFQALLPILSLLTPYYEALGVAIKVLATPFVVLATILTWIVGHLTNFGIIISNIVSRPLRPGTWADGTTDPGNLSANIGSAVSDLFGPSKLPELGDHTIPGAMDTPAQYTTGRNITVNIEINTDVIAGPGGIRDLSLMIRDEIRSAEALGA